MVGSISSFSTLGLRIYSFFISEVCSKEIFFPDGKINEITAIFFPARKVKTSLNMYDLNVAIAL